MKNIQDYYLELLAAWGDTPIDEEGVKEILATALKEVAEKALNEVAEKAREEGRQEVLDEWEKEQEKLIKGFSYRPKKKI